MNSYKRGVLIGMLWGDGCLKLKKHTKIDGSISNYTEFVIGHSSKQEEYIKCKRDKFHSIMGGKIPKIHSRNFYLGSQLHTELRFSRQHKYFNILHRWMYPNGKKQYTRFLLDMMNEEGLAYWYQDDGCLDKKKRKDGTISSVEMRIYTYCSEKEADIIIEYLKDTYNIVARKRKYRKKEQYNIVMNTLNAKKFELLIKDYVVPSMMYKLPSKWVHERPTP